MYFVSVLQAKYGDAPMQMKDIVEKLRQLDTPSVSREKVWSVKNVYTSCACVLCKHMIYTVIHVCA